MRRIDEAEVLHPCFFVGRHSAPSLSIGRSSAPARQRSDGSKPLRARVQGRRQWLNRKAETRQSILRPALGRYCAICHCAPLHQPSTALASTLSTFRQGQIKVSWKVANCRGVSELHCTGWAELTNL